MRLSAEQIARIVQEIEAVDYGEILVRVAGPGRDVRVIVSRSLIIEGRSIEPLDKGNKTR